MVLLGLILYGMLALINALPLAFFGMLFLGNLGLHLSFIAVLSGSIAVKLVGHNIIQLPSAKAVADANRS